MTNYLIDFFFNNILTFLWVNCLPIVAHLIKDRQVLFKLDLVLWSRLDVFVDTTLDRFILIDMTDSKFRESAKCVV